MQIIINSFNVTLDSVHVRISTDSIARQFTLLDISKNAKYKKGDIVEIYDDSNTLLIKAEIEYIKVNMSSSKSEFVYAGRNNAKYIVDCYADRTIQFSENQKLNTVLKELVNDFGLKIEGNAKLPTDSSKTVLVGSKLGEALVEIAHSAGQIITSDAYGNIIVNDKAKKQGNKTLEFGVNLNDKELVEDSTHCYDKYIVFSQSNYLINQKQYINVNGAYGNGKNIRTIVSKHNLTEMECESLAETEYKKDKLKSFIYSATTNEIDLELNNAYLLKDESVDLKELMNLKTIEISINKNVYETKIYLERIL